MDLWETQGQLPEASSDWVFGCPKLQQEAEPHELQEGVAIPLRKTEGDPQKRAPNKCWDKAVYVCIHTDMHIYVYNTYIYMREREREFASTHIDPELEETCLGPGIRNLFNRSHKTGTGIQGKSTFGAWATCLWMGSGLR